METTKIVIFKNKQVRKTLYHNEWWFSVIDVIEAVTESERPRKYWADLKKKLIQEEYAQLSEKIGQLKLPSSDGKRYETDCGDTETIFRIVQSIPSPKAEPFKRWLAKVGYERVQEIENSELATKRTRMLYKLKGYSEDWIEKRMRGIVIREELTDDFELIFNMLGERATTEIHRTEDSRGVAKLKHDAHRGGNIAGGARKELEKEIGRSVVTKKNFLKGDGSKKKRLSK